MKNNKYIIIILILFNILSILFNIIIYKKYNILNEKNKIGTVEIVKVDSFLRVDTITKYYPKPISKIIIDTMYIDKDSIQQEGDSILLQRETKTYEDSTYRAVISGYKSSLDEITVYPVTKYITTEKVREITKKERFTWGLQFGAGYGIFSRKPDIYVGIGCQINF